MTELVLSPVTCVVERFLAELADVRFDLKVDVLMVIEFGFIEEGSFAAGLVTSERPKV